MSLLQIYVRPFITFCLPLQLKASARPQPSILARMETKAESNKMIIVSSDRCSLCSEHSIHLKAGMPFQQQGIYFIQEGLKPL